MKYKHCPKCGQINPQKSLTAVITANSHFDLVVLPNGVRAFILKKEYRNAAR